MQSSVLDSSRSQLCNDTSTGVVRHQITKWRRLQKVVSYDVLHHMNKTLSSKFLSFALLPGQFSLFPVNQKKKERLQFFSGSCRYQILSQWPRPSMQLRLQHRVYRLSDGKDDRLTENLRTLTSVWRRELARNANQWESLQPGWERNRWCCSGWVEEGEEWKYAQLGTVKLTGWRHWLNLHQTNQTASRSVCTTCFAHLTCDPG